MRITLNFLIMALWAYNSFAQSAFFVEVDSHPESETYNSLVETDEGLLTVGGQVNSSTNPPNDQDGQITQFDHTGQMLWSKKSNNYYFEQFDEVIKVNNNLFIAGIKSDVGNSQRKRFILKTDLEGNPIFHVTYGDTSGSLGANRTEAMLSVNDGILIAGSTTNQATGSTDGSITKFDFNGGVIWSKTFADNVNEPYIDYVKECKPIEGGFILLLYTQKESSQYAIGTQNLIKIDEQGNELWRQNVSNYPVPAELSIPQTGNEVVHITPVQSGEFIMLLRANDTNQKAFHTYLVRLDGLGQEISTFAYLDSMDYRSSDLIFTQDEELVLIGMDLFQLPSDWASKHLIIRWDENLVLSSYSRAGADETINWQTNGIRTSDGGFASTGYIFRPQPGNSKNNPILVKTDCRGNTIWDYSSCSIQYGGSEILVFPNPSDGLFQFHLPTKGEYTFTIFDYLGRLVSEDQTDLCCAFTLDLSNYSSGVYHCEIRRAGEPSKTSLKLVIE